MSVRGAALAAGLVLASLATGAVAGSVSGGEPQFPPEKIVALAKKVEREVAARGARVALISRVGRPESELPEGVRYTHVAFVVYSRIRTSDGRDVPGYAVYNLYQSDEVPQTSSLVQDYPLDYFAAVFALRSGVIIPTPKLQRRLLEVIFSDVYAGLHNPRYSAISNPFNSRFQNCTEFVLDVLNAAIYGTGDPRQLKVNAAAWFEPQPVDIGPFRLLLASLFVPDVATSDHSGPIRTATYGSIARYLERNALVVERFEVTVD